VVARLADELPGLRTFATLSPLPGLAATVAQGRLQGWVEGQGSEATARLALAYLTQVQRGLGVADPVAHFHLSNGARLKRILPEADPSPAGAPSLGVMANYLYDLGELEANHEEYLQAGRVAMAPGLAAQARRVEKARAAGGEGSTPVRRRLGLRAGGGPRHPSTPGGPPPPPAPASGAGRPS
jgi:malonyl-CoA decarboxylase